METYEENNYAHHEAKKDVADLLKIIGYSDISYGNDTTASFQNLQETLKVWVFSANPDQNEFPVPSRFVVCEGDNANEIGSDLFDTNNITSLIKYLQKA